MSIERKTKSATELAAFALVYAFAIVVLILDLMVFRP